MPNPGDYTNFFQGLIGGTGVLLGFTLASQITILTHVLDLSELDLISNPNKNKILIILTWFFSFVTIILSFCLVTFHAASTDKPEVYVRDELAACVRIAYLAYIFLPVLIVVSQIICSYVITKMLRRRAKE
jgi:hypothetical protein